MHAAAEALESSGYEAEIADRYVAKGPAAQWLIEIGVKSTIEGFFLALGAAGFTKLARTVFESEEGEDRGRLEVLDKDGTRLTMSSRLPDEAVSALRDMDWSNIRGGSLTWVADRRAWETTG
ncbi:MAG TPA: hypothetical protein VF255_06700 [Solirubrobacterales bacterium]